MLINYLQYQILKPCFRSLCIVGEPCFKEAPLKEVRQHRFKSKIIALNGPVNMIPEDMHQKPFKGQGVSFVFTAESAFELADHLIRAADEIDETVEWMRQYIAKLAEQKAAAEESIEEPVQEPVLPAKTAAAEQEELPASEINGSVLAESPAIAKA